MANAGDTGRVNALPNDVLVVCTYENKLWVVDKLSNQMATVHVSDFKPKQKPPRRFLHGKNDVDVVELTPRVMEALAAAGIQLESVAVE